MTRHSSIDTQLVCVKLKEANKKEWIGATDGMKFRNFKWINIFAVDFILFFSFFSFFFFVTILLRICSNEFFIDTDLFHTFFFLHFDVHRISFIYRISIEVDVLTLFWFISICLPSDKKSVLHFVFYILSWNAIKWKKKKKYI